MTVQKRSLREYYESVLGTPSGGVEYSFRTGLNVEILKWRAEVTDLGVDLYASIGASGFVMPGVDSVHRVEYYIGLIPGVDDVGTTLAECVASIHDKRVRVGHGDTISLMRRLWPGTEMTRLLVLRPLNEIIFPTIDLPGGVHIEFLVMLPLFEEEFQFKKIYGWEELISRWSLASIPFWSSDRELDVGVLYDPPHNISAAPSQDDASSG